MNNRILRSFPTFIRCKGTGKPIVCPDGDEVDWSLGAMEELAGCRMEEW